MTTSTDIASPRLGDPARLRALRRTGLLGSPSEEAFDRLTRLASRLLGAPVALVSLVEEDRQFFKSCLGLPEPWASRRGTPLRHSFCQHVVASGEPLLIEDAREHPLVRDNLAIRDLNVIAYLGIPLVTSDGHALGSFCAIDDRPRAWSEHEVATMRDLAASVVTEIELHAAVAEAQALAAEREAILAQTAEGVIVAGPDGRITFVNEAAKRMHGVAELGTPVEQYSDTYHLYTLEGAPYPSSELPMAQAVLRGETVVDALWRIRRSDGQEIVAQGSATPVWAEDGRRLGSVLVLRDITAQYELDRQKDEFLATASHDLKNPLTTIRGVAQLLRRQAARSAGVDPERLHSGLVNIEASTEQMSRLLDELLDTTRLRMGRPLQLERTPTDLVALARQSVAAHQATTERHYLRLVAPEQHVTGLWDPSRLERVLDNLLSNAIKYSPEGGEITVTVERQDGEWVALSVADQGVGIPAADLPRVFGQFQRAANVAGHIAGSGIGLSSVRHVVEQHGGRVTVESREGEGSIFTVLLPLAAG